MERYVWVKQARAWFADVLNTAAYASDRVVILRRGEELGAFVGMADLDFLRRHRPTSRYPEPPALEMPPSPEEQFLENREAKLRTLERLLERGQGGAELAREVEEERASIAEWRKARFRPS